MPFKNLLTFAICACLPKVCKPWLLNALGHSVHRNSTIAFSFIWGAKLFLGEGASIGLANVLLCRRLVMRDHAILGRCNVIRGPISVVLKDRAALGNLNHACRGNRPVTAGPAQLRLGILAKITSGHFIDCTQTVSLGAASTVAGNGSQLWTHGYVHELTGEGRYRLDGRIRIGNNVYLGSGACVTAGVSIGDGVSVAPLTAVTRSISEPGLYFGQVLRHVARLPEDRRSGLQRLAPGELCEPVYWKEGGGPSPLVGKDGNVTSA